MCNIPLHASHGQDLGLDLFQNYSQLIDVKIRLMNGFTYHMYVVHNLCPVHTYE